MNSLMKYAKTVTIRNLQLEDKVKREQLQKDADRARELEMEIQRLEQIKVWCSVALLRRHASNCGGNTLLRWRWSSRLSYPLLHVVVADVP